MSAAQDPTEPFDLVDAEGNPTGAVKPRAEVHRDGDWHRALHLWVVIWDGDTPRIVLQRRGSLKDTNPGLVDVSVGGHLRAGESMSDALRESEEEIGLAVAPDEVERIGTRYCEKSGEGWVDREVQWVYAAHADVDFASLRPNADEVDALYAPTLDDAFDLELGLLPSIEAPALLPGRPVERATLTLADFVPDPAGYRRASLATLSVWCAGAPWSPFVLR